MCRIIDRSTVDKDNQSGIISKDSNWIDYRNIYEKETNFDISMLVDIELSLRKDLKVMCRKNNNENELKRLMKLDGELYINKV